MAENIPDEEYSVQYYGFSSETFYKDFVETVMEEMTLVVQQSLTELSSPTSKLKDKKKLRENLLIIHNTWSQRAAVILEKLKPTINEFFKIPKNVLLPVDAIHAKQYSEEEIKKLEEEVKLAEEMYAKEVNDIQLYKAEIAALEKLEPIQKKVDEAIIAINQFGSTLSEIVELERVATTHKQLLDNTQETRAIHDWKYD